MIRSPRRRAAVALASLLALAAAPLMQPAGAATNNSTQNSSQWVTDVTGDTKRLDKPATETRADITLVTARYQNDFISFTMTLVKGGVPNDVDTMFWSVGAHESMSPDFIVEFKKGSNGFGQAVVSNDPGGAPINCLGTSASFDVAAGTYMATIPASCVGSPASFQWSGYRQVAGAPGSDPVWDWAPDNGIATSAVNTKVTGYWAMGSDGKAYPFGDAPTMNAGPPSAIDIEASPHGTGYWSVDDKGIVSAFGPAHYGNVSDLKAGEKAVSISGTPTGNGYWVFTNKGRAIAFGDANKNLGDVSKIPLNADVLDSSPTSTGNGYYMVAADGGVFALGDAKFEGSMGSTPLNKPVRSIVPDPDGTGYWLVASDGGVFSFKAPFRGSTGSMKLNKPMTGMVPFGDGYLMVAEDGGVFNFSNQAFSGSLGNNPPTNPIVSITALS